MEKERYSKKKILQGCLFSEGLFEIKDRECKKWFLLIEDKKNADKIVEILNQQDARIKKLEEKNQKANINNYLADYNLVEKENQQLREQLLDEQIAHDLCIDSFNEECEKLRKQIKFESEARERFKQTQNEKAIEVLEDITKAIRYAKEVCGGKATDLDVVSANAYNRCLDDMQKIIDNQIKLLGGKNEYKRISYKNRK